MTQRRKRSSTTRRSASQSHRGEKSGVPSASNLPDVEDDDLSENAPPAPSMMDILTAAALGLQQQANGLQRQADALVMLIGVVREQQNGRVLRRVDGKPLTHDDVRKLVAQARGETPDERPRFFGDKQQRGEAEAHHG